MKASGSVETGLVTLPAALRGTEAVERLKSLLAQEGIELFAQIDHAAGAEKVRLSRRPTQVLMFGNPQADTPADAGPADPRARPAVAGWKTTPRGSVRRCGTSSAESSLADGGRPAHCGPLGHRPAQLAEDDLDPDRKAAMVSNLLVVLCGERDAQPVISIGGSSS
jgi:hypothetical protein